MEEKKRRQRVEQKKKKRVKKQIEIREQNQTFNELVNKWKSDMQTDGLTVIK